MTALPERAVARAQSLPDEQRDALAAMLFDEIEADARWKRTLTRPEPQARLADEAMAEHRAGQTR